MTIIVKLNRLKNITISYESLVNRNSLKHTFDYRINDTLSFDGVLGRITKGNTKYREDQIDHRWKRRRLCTISDDKYSAKRFLDKIASNVDKTETEKKRTLLDFDGPILLNDIDDPDSLKAHVRVKRTGFESDSIHHQDYLKDLANSFPRDSYELIDENSYDDDVSFDQKREIKSNEYFANDERFDASKIQVPAHLSKGESFLNTPSDAKEVNAFENKNRKFVDQTGNRVSALLKASPDNDNTFMDRREGSEVQSVPDDPMLALKLVRKKRNDYRSASNEERVSNDEKRSALTKSVAHVNPSRSTLANLKVDLLRMRRKAKDKRYEKKSKSKKKKKHAGKKHQGPLQSVKDVRLRNTDRSRMSRAKKSNDVKREGKSIVEIDNAMAKKSNGNNFRRRFVNSKELLENTDSGNGGTKASIASMLHEKLKSASENKIDTLNHWLPAGGNTISNENINAVVTQSKKQESSVDNERSMQDAKLRTKRDKHAASKHGFSNEEEELRYYQNIREPGSEMDECIDENESQLSSGNEVGGNRAVRSIEEVKELAKKLVTKVNELQNYLNIEEVGGNEKQGKKIETRAIDDLCSNVSAGCYAFKDTPNVVQKCVSTNRVEPRARIVERKAGPVKNPDERKVVGTANKNVERKRSVGSRRVVKMSSPGTSKVVRKQAETKSGRKWGKWTDWSSCSVTCGKGRQIRWRYCLRDCSTAETEMEEKACQLPACPPGKFLGIF
ncbi:uncharacterized protein LOC143431485 [Xylocopa sonorina]|uniref:uncharacterized protein LOC143431485 n=1 Tax=Xylocopa sonorina TaxID=1818115 RepID=UPI00403ABFE6